MRSVADFSARYLAASDVSPLATPSEHDQAEADLPGDTPLYQHTSFADTLNDSSHGKNPSATF